MLLRETKSRGDETKDNKKKPEIYEKALKLQENVIHNTKTSKDVLKRAKLADNIKDDYNDVLNGIESQVSRNLSAIREKAHGEKGHDKGVLPSERLAERLGRLHKSSEEILVVLQRGDTKEIETYIENFLSSSPPEATGPKKQAGEGDISQVEDETKYPALEVSQKGQRDFRNALQAANREFLQGYKPPEVEVDHHTEYMLVTPDTNPSKIVQALKLEPGKAATVSIPIPERSFWGVTRSMFIGQEALGVQHALVVIPKRDLIDRGKDLLHLSKNPYGDLPKIVEELRKKLLLHVMNIQIGFYDSGTDKVTLGGNDKGGKDKFKPWLQNNQKFLEERKGTSKPADTESPENLKRVIIRCMDPRLSLSDKAFGSGPETMDLRTAGATWSTEEEHNSVIEAIRLAYDQGADDVGVIGHTKCGVCKTDVGTIIDKRGIDMSNHTLDGWRNMLGVFANEYDNSKAKARELKKLFPDMNVLPGVINIHTLEINHEKPEQPTTPVASHS